MFDVRNFYKEENEKVLENYEKTIQSIKGIYDESIDYEKFGEKREYYKFFNYVSKFILEIAEMEKNLDDEYFKTKSFEELKDENYILFSDLLPENYKNSYANPTYGVEVFGDNIGQTFSAMYTKFRGYIGYAYKHKVFQMEKFNRLFIEVFSYVKDNTVTYEGLKRLISKYEAIGIDKDYEYYFIENLNKDYRFITDIVLNSDMNDLRYLFKYGVYITENEIKTAQFLASYPLNKLNTLSDAIAKAYVNGFIRDNKDISKRSNVRIIGNVGQEMITRNIIKDLKERNLEGFVSEIISTDYNKQYAYDHKFDNALHLDKEFEKLMSSALENEADKSSDFLKEYSGILYIEKFGEEPFSPESKKERLKLSDEQMKYYQKNRHKIREVFEKHMPDTETSFCIVAFPTPEIGDNFEEIFEEILKVNMLDSEKYEVIQQTIIDALDKGEYIHVKGSGNNRTDIKIKMYELKNPDKETNYVNCVADVNVPLGEVFTSPVLKDTNGILHIDEIYLDGFKYYNLELTIQNGYVTDYNCTNFDNEEANKEYIKENLLFPHKTLPIGEFAIGTNTLAYMIAEKYGIMEKLPILIIEKMGPHFALGDTCFSWSEDIPVYNMLDNKEIVARDNEKSILRKTNIEEAYTNRHTDLTLPYYDLELITSITKDGKEIDIIRDGRFVLRGTEELNKPLDK